MIIRPKRLDSQANKLRIARLKKERDAQDTTTKPTPKARSKKNK